MAHLRRRRPGLLVGIIGCMAERLRERLLEGENPVDIVAGPDAYRDLPRLVREAGEGGRGVNVLLSREETYAEIAPVRLCAGATTIVRTAWCLIRGAWSAAAIRRLF